MASIDALEHSIADSISRMRGPFKRKAAPIAGIGATVGLASGAFLWHVNKEDQRRYGAR